MLGIDRRGRGGEAGEEGVGEEEGRGRVGGGTKKREGRIWEGVVVVLPRKLF